MSISLILEIVSCVFTVVALLFTLYTWLVDRNDEDSIEFYKKKETYLATLKEQRDIIVDPKKKVSEEPDIKANSNNNNRHGKANKKRMLPQKKQKKSLPKTTLLHRSLLPMP